MSTSFRHAFAIVLIGICGQQVSASQLMACAVKKVSPDGARVNLKDAGNGLFKANLIFGTTVSGKLYWVREVEQGVYEGSVKGKPEFTMRLTVNQGETTQNKYIDGFKSSLNVIYPDLNAPDGVSQFVSRASDNFVCGTQIAPYRD